MYAKLLNVDKFVSANGLKPVTDPVFMDSNGPTENGLFSHSIFGVNPTDRQETWAYMSLNGWFLHPHAALLLKEYGKRFELLYMGIRRYRFEDGDIVEDPEGETGLDFLYKIYDKIVWRDSSSTKVSEKIELLKDKKTVFLNKFPVMPPFRRDIRDGDVMAVHEVNKIYRNIISQSKNITASSMFGTVAKANIQSNLIALYRYLIKDEFSGKKGIMRLSVLGTNIFRGSRMVISSEVIKSLSDNMVDHEHTAVPLQSCISMMYDHIFVWVKTFFDNEFIRSGRFKSSNDKGEVEYLDIIKSKMMSDKDIKKRMDEFIDSPSSRFESIKVPENKQGVVDRDVYIVGRFDEISEKRVLTWTDVFYMAAVDCAKDKYCMITRYPIEDVFNIVYSKIVVASTVNTKSMSISGREYKYYPVVEPNADAAGKFRETLVFSNLYIMGLGADFDGDTVSIRILFSEEANADARKFMTSKKNVLSFTGSNMRTIERDFVQLLYCLTKRPDNTRYVHQNLSRVRRKELV